MRNLIAIPVILLAVILQSSVVTNIRLLSGHGDLPLVMLAAWALQDDVDNAWHWAVALGTLVGFVSSIPWFIPIIGFLVVVFSAQNLQRRIWRAPLLAMFTVTFLGTIVVNILSLAGLRISGVLLPINEVLGLIVLPAILLNLLLAIPAYAVMRDLAHWAYPAPEVE
jgi:hypothetical protein